MAKVEVFMFDDDYFLVLHLMISGRLQWRDAGAKIPGKVGLAALDFDNGTLTITEASSKKRASLHLVRSREALGEFDRGGLEVLEASLEEFRAAMTRENHTLRRALTDPSILSGIGNAYSDEICHRARLSPVLLTEKMTDEETERLYHATRQVLSEWAQRLLAEAGDTLPKKVTAFHEGMAVHGRFGKPCPVCGTPVQRIRYANNETNYCPECQNGGRLLADRSLSRLLKKDWPRSMDELDALYGRTTT
jgi:formamidopyrimidine-DNA glycosylase